MTSLPEPLMSHKNNSAQKQSTKLSQLCWSFEALRQYGKLEGSGTALALTHKLTDVMNVHFQFFFFERDELHSDWELLSSELSQLTVILNRWRWWKVILMMNFVRLLAMMRWCDQCLQVVFFHQRSWLLRVITLLWCYLRYALLCVSCHISELWLNFFEVGTLGDVTCNLFTVFCDLAQLDSSLYRISWVC